MATLFRNRGPMSGPFGLITVSMFLNALGFTIAIPVLPFLIADYVAPARVGVMVGVITAIFAVCQFFAAPVLGGLSDAHGRRPVLIVSLLGSAVGFAVFGVGGALWVLVLGRAIDGLTGGNIATMLAYVADVTPPQDRSRLFGILGATAGFGFVIGPAVGGLLAGASLTTPIFLAAAVAVVNALWAFFALPESLPPERRTNDFSLGHLNPFAPFGLVLQTPALLTAFAVAFCFYLAASMLQTIFAVFTMDILHFSPAAIGAALGAVGVMDVLTQGVLVGRLLPRLGEERLAQIGLVLNAAGFALFAALGQLPLLTLGLVALVVSNLGDGLFQPSISGIVANAAPPDAQGRVQGANQGQQSLARVAGPLLAAALYAVNPGAPFAVGAVVVLLGLAVLTTSQVRARAVA